MTHYIGDVIEIHEEALAPRSVTLFGESLSPILYITILFSRLREQSLCARIVFSVHLAICLE
jgi:hypothetical protein